MRTLAIVAVLLATSAHAAPVPKSELAVPPANAAHWIIMSTGGKHGDSWSWIAADGTRMARESMNLRGQVWEMDATGKAGADRQPDNLVVRGVTPQGDAAETFAIKTGTANWKSPVDAGSASYVSPAFYGSYGGPMGINAWFVENLLAQPGKTLALLPGGKATATKLLDTQVGSGATAQTVTLWKLSGLSTTPVPVWTDANGKFFAISFGIGWIPAGYEGDKERLEKLQTDALAAQMPALARSLAVTPSTPVAFTDVRIFDAPAKRFVDGQTVVVDRGLIVSVGAAGTAKVPANAKRIAGNGMTLVPGMWDSHMHVGDDYTGIQELSLGVTSVRDPGNDDAKTLDRRGRVARGELLMPNVYPSSLIDGKGPNTAQVANVATSQAEAIALIDKAAANRFTGVKFYGTFNPAWLPAAIAEAHAKGLHVHGHIPQGMRPLAAIADGYDEITHINWVIMEAMPDSVIAESNGIMRFQGPGRYAKGVDLDAPPMTTMVATMAGKVPSGKKVTSDPTMVAFEGLYVPENGDLSPAYAPFVGTLPPTVERGFRSGGFAVPADLTRADFRASWAKMVALLGKMNAAGVPIVAGTDGNGIEIVRELEIYREAGMSAGEALYAATLAPAKLVGADKTTGSIEAGKVADLVLVEGDPSTSIGALRQTRVVMMGGKLMDADALRAAAGFAGRPK